MITREDIHTVLQKSHWRIYEKEDRDEAINGILKLIESELSKHQALVDAAVAWVGDDLPVPEFSSPEWHALRKAVQPFLKPLLSEKLDKLADRYPDTDVRCVELRQLADRARELEINKHGSLDGLLEEK